MAKGTYAIVNNATAKVKKMYDVNSGLTRKIKKAYDVVDGLTKLSYVSSVSLKRWVVLQSVGSGWYKNAGSSTWTQYSTNLVKPFGASSWDMATDSSLMTEITYGQGKYWICVKNNNNVAICSSADGITWASEAIINPGTLCDGTARNNYDYLNLFYSKLFDRLYLVVRFQESSTYAFYILSSTDGVSWTRCYGTTGTSTNYTSNIYFDFGYVDKFGGTYGSRGGAFTGEGMRDFETSRSWGVGFAALYYGTVAYGYSSILYTNNGTSFTLTTLYPEGWNGSSKGFSILNGIEWFEKKYVFTWTCTTPQNVQYNITSYSSYPNGASTIVSQPTSYYSTGISLHKIKDKVWTRYFYSDASSNTRVAEAYSLDGVHWTSQYPTMYRACDKYADGEVLTLLYPRTTSTTSQGAVGTLSLSHYADASTTALDATASWYNYYSSVIHWSACYGVDGGEGDPE